MKKTKKSVSAEKKINELEKKNHELLNDLQRIQAEFENYKKRIEKEKEKFKELTNCTLIQKLLPVIDSIDSALKHLNELNEVKKEEAIQGVELIKKQLMELLKKEGLQEINACGEKFDPSMHECLMKGHEEEKEDDIVLEELQKGYKVKGIVIRPAKVKVNKKEKKEEEKINEKEKSNKEEN